MSSILVLLQSENGKNGDDDKWEPKDTKKNISAIYVTRTIYHFQLRTDECLCQNVLKVGIFS